MANACKASIYVFSNHMLTKSIKGKTLGENMCYLRLQNFYHKFFALKNRAFVSAKVLNERISTLITGMLFMIFCVSFVSDVRATTSLASHKVNYTLSMGKSNQNAVIQDVRGTISFALSAQCDGWSITEDYLFQFLYESGEEITVFSHSDSWEDKNGHLYSFDVREQNSYEPETIYTGFAMLHQEREVGEASYAGAYEETLDLSNEVLFPVKYTLAMIEAAQNGKRLMSKQLFVNSIPQDAVKTASAVIGNKKLYNSDIQINGVTTTHYWPVNIAYFKTDSTQATPEYQIQMDLHDNGVVSDFLINYGDFSIHASISDGSLIEIEDCT